MKRKMAVLLLAALLLTAWLPGQALATTRRDEALEWLWEAIADHVYRLEASFTVDCSPYADILDTAVKEDHMIWGMVFSMGMYDYKVSYTNKTHALRFEDAAYMPGFTVLQKLNYGMEMTAEENKLLQYAGYVSQEAWTKGNDLRRERFIHDWLIEHVTYKTAGDDVHSVYNNAYGAILYGAGECDAYADAFYLIGGLSGLTVGYQAGLADGKLHQWNAIRLTDPATGHPYWQMIDVTYDDFNIPDHPAACMYTYFHFGLNRMKTHEYHGNQYFRDYSNTLAFASFFGNTLEPDFGLFLSTYDDVGRYIKDHRKDPYIYFLVDQPYNEAALHQGIKKAMPSRPAYQYWYEELHQTTAFVFWFK